MSEPLTSAREYEKELTRIFNRFNKHFWNNELPEVIITFVPTPMRHGHMSSASVWHSKNKDVESKYELNISALDIDRTPEEICGTLLHEQVHLYCAINDIKDTSNNHRYHNKTFKRIAEDHGLIISLHPDPTIGWSKTELDENAKKYVKKLNVKQFELHRDIHTSKTPLIRMQCPDCLESVCWVSSLQELICGYCGASLIPMASQQKRVKKYKGMK